MEVLVTSPWIPAEWIEAHGLAPKGVWANVASAGAPCHCGRTGTPAVAEGVCAFAQDTAVLSAQRGSSIVFSTACDQMRRAADSAAMVDAVAERVFLFNLPSTWQTPAARQLYRCELLRLSGFLQRLGGKVPTDGDLAKTIIEYENRRARVRAAVANARSRNGAELMLHFFFDGSVSEPEPPKNSNRDGVPLAIVGGPLLPAEWKLFDAIESLGGSVVLNASEPGERCLLPPLPPIAPGHEPLAALVDHYFDNSIDVFHRPNSRLYDWLEPRLASRKVRGIVLWVHVGCDLWRAESAGLREAFGLPVLVLDSHDANPAGLRDFNRLAAFVESLAEPVDQ